MDHDGSQLTALLDRPIAFHKVFLLITSSASAAIMLSQAWYWRDRSHVGGGWFWKTQKDWTEETGLSDKEQLTARKLLVRMGLIEESRRDIPAKMYFRLNLPNILKEIDKSFRSSRLPQQGNLDSPDAGILYPPTGESNTETTSEITNKNTRLFEDGYESIIETEIFPYFLEQTGRNGNLYTLTPPRMKCGVARFKEALKKAIDNLPDNAKELMRIAIDTLAASDWHMGRDPKTHGKKYSDWADLFGTTDKFEKWLDRAE